MLLLVIWNMKYSYIKIRNIFLFQLGKRKE